MKVVIIGCGDIGARVAQRWQARGVLVQGLVQSAPSAQRLRKLGIEPHVANLDQPSSLAGVDVSKALVY